MKKFMSTVALATFLACGILSDVHATKITIVTCPNTTDGWYSSRPLAMFVNATLDRPGGTFYVSGMVRPFWPSNVKGGVNQTYCYGYGVYWDRVLYASRYKTETHHSLSSHNLNDIATKVFRGTKEQGESYPAPATEFSFDYPAGGKIVLHGIAQYGVTNRKQDVHFEPLKLTVPKTPITFCITEYTPKKFYFKKCSGCNY